MDQEVDCTVKNQPDREIVLALGPIIRLPPVCKLEDLLPLVLKALFLRTPPEAGFSVNHATHYLLQVKKSLRKVFLIENFFLTLILHSYLKVEEIKRHQHP